MTRLPLLLILLAPAVARADEEEGDSNLPPLSVYGFARLDVLADDAKLSDVAQPMYVQRMPGKQEGEMTLTPRMSRVGLSIDDWEVGQISELIGTGKLEVDFSGGSGTNALRLRQAYGAVTVGKRVELLAGQTEDLISPLIPTAQNDTQLLFAGNVGDRRPQVRLSVLGDNVRAAVALAATGMIQRQDLDANGMTDSVTGGMFEWLVEGKLRVRHMGTFKLGVSGHVAREERPDSTTRGASSVGIHFFMPMITMVAIQGEGYLGQNTADIGGGIGQGLDPMTGHRIGGLGGWAELVVAPTKKHLFAGGTSIDTARGDDLHTGDRTKNGTVYGVLRYRPIPSIQLAVEYLWWKTAYKDLGQATANRYDMHLSVFF